MHRAGTLALAGACYSLPELERKSLHSSGVSVWRALWPWDREWWKPSTPARDKCKGATLIIAERAKEIRAETKGQQL